MYMEEKKRTLFPYFAVFSFCGPQRPNSQSEVSELAVRNDRAVGLLRCCLRVACSLTILVDYISSS